MQDNPENVDLEYLAQYINLILEDTVDQSCCWVDDLEGNLSLCGLDAE